MTGPLAAVDLAILLSFGCGALVAVWSAVVISGFLPLRLGPGARNILQATTVIGASGVIAVLVLVLCLTVPLLPTAVAVIAAGLAVLTAPFLAQPIPESLRSSELAPVAVVAISLAALFVLPNPF